MTECVKVRSLSAGSAAEAQLSSDCIKSDNREPQHPVGGASDCDFLSNMHLIILPTNTLLCSSMGHIWVW